MANILDQKSQQSIAERYHQVLGQIEAAALAAGRDPHAIRLVVVTKNHPIQAVREVIAAGARHLGENYAEEGVKKILECMPFTQVEWHMIGHIQSRKANFVSQYYDWVHSLDSLKIAQRLNRFAAEQERRLPVLIEGNTSGETSKYGFPLWDKNSWKEILAAVRDIAAMPFLNVRGLMTLAPTVADAEQTRPYFSLLRDFGEYLQKNLPQVEFSEYSMGMSADYQVAIQEGATMVRVGTAIMGERRYTAEKETL